MDKPPELLHTWRMHKYGKPLFVVFMLVTMVSVCWGIYSTVRARAKTLATIACEGRDYRVVRMDYSKDKKFFMLLTIEERASGLKLEWPKETRTTPAERTVTPITLWSTSEAPRKISDVTVVPESAPVEPHLDCLKKILPEVRQVLLGIVSPYAGVPEFVSADDEAVLLWK